jgi:hypothetical protein
LKNLKTLVFAVGLAMCFADQPMLAQHDMSQMPRMGGRPELPLGIPFSRLGSGTSWLPDDAPMHGVDVSLGDWALMLHGVAYGQYDQQNGFRHDSQTGLIDWEMLMAMHSLAGGLFRVNAMTSLEALVLGPTGYPELLQTGGSYQGGRLVNRQHPHDLVSELAAAYDHSLTTMLAASVYAAVVGEPALGPVSYMHRPSSVGDPFAPLGHHWQDASHESFGVITLGAYTRALKVEGSIFNAREPDSYYYNFDYQGARLDSYSGRITVLPTASLAISAWGGYLMAHDPLETPIGMQRYGASILSENDIGGRLWSSAAIWGVNIHHHGSREHNHDPNATNVKTYHVSASALLETTVSLTKRTELHGRLEQVQKSGDDLGFLGGDLTQLFTIRSASLAATHDFVSLGPLWIGLGLRGSLNLLPETLRLTYQSTTTTGYSAFLRVR